MAYSLPPSIRLALLDGDAVWLDLNEDSYLCTPNAALAWTQDGHLLVSDAALANDLIEANLLATRESGLRRQILPPPPIADRLTSVLSSTAIRMPFWWWARGFWRLYRHGHTAPIRKLIQLAAAVQPRLSCDGRAQPAQALARSIQVVQRWQPAAGECLQRSFQMVCMLREAGVACRWVFGVRTWPFVAHCWVEADGVALNDSAERLAAFQPILSA